MSMGEISILEGLDYLEESYWYGHQGQAKCQKKMNYRPYNLIGLAGNWTQ